MLHIQSTAIRTGRPNCGLCPFMTYTPRWHLHLGTFAGLAGRSLERTRIQLWSVPSSFNVHKFSELFPFFPSTCHKKIFARHSQIFSIRFSFPNSSYELMWVSYMATRVAKVCGLVACHRKFNSIPRLCHKVFIQCFRFQWFRFHTPQIPSYDLAISPLPKIQPKHAHSFSCGYVHKVQLIEVGWDVQEFRVHMLRWLAHTLMDTVAANFCGALR